MKKVKKRLRPRLSLTVESDVFAWVVATAAARHVTVSRLVDDVLRAAGGGASRGNGVAGGGERGKE